MGRFTFTARKFLNMFTRRHIRIKVMQSVYSLHKDPEQELKALNKKFQGQLLAAYDLYYVMLALLIAIHKRAKEQFDIKKKQEHRQSTILERNPAFIQNRLLVFLANHQALNDVIVKKKLRYWEHHFDYVDQLLKKIETASIFERHMQHEAPNWESDCMMVTALYREVIAPYDPLIDFIEDQNLSWADDYSLVNTFILKQFKKLKPEQPSSLQFPSPVDQQDEKKFGKELLKKTLAQQAVLKQEIQGKTPNWESDRIAQLDLVLLQLGITELLFFESIPPKVTLNEYLEIAKDYSTPKSNVFINGVLDKLVKDYIDNNRMKKSGRGLKD